MGIAYDDDIDRAMEVIKDELSKDERVLAEPAPLVAVGELADSSVNLLVRPWASNADFFATMLDLRKKLKQRLDKEGFTIPFPQRDVHLYKTS
jgi:small conductance mechanosensitive channel